MARLFCPLIALAALLSGCPGADECQSGFDCAPGEACVLDEGGNRCEVPGDGDCPLSPSAAEHDGESDISVVVPPVEAVFLGEAQSVTASVSEAACCYLVDGPDVVDRKDVAGDDVTFSVTLDTATYSDAEGNWGHDYTVTCDNNAAGAETFRIEAHPPATFSLSISANGTTKTESVGDMPQAAFPVVSTNASVTAEYQVMHASACISTFWGAVGGLERHAHPGDPDRGLRGLHAELRWFQLSRRG